MFCLTTAFFPPQSSAADVFYCIFNRRKDSHGSHRRQVQTFNTSLKCVNECICSSVLFSWSSPPVSINVQRSDSGRTGGAEDGAAWRRYLHAQRFSKSKPSVHSMGNWSHTPNSLASDLLKWGSFEFIATDASKPLPQASEQIYYGTGDGE